MAKYQRIFYGIMVIVIGSVSKVQSLNPVMVNGIRARDPRGLNKGCGLKFCVGSQVWLETPEEGQRTHRLKHCEYNNKDEDNSLKIPNDKNHQASSQKSRQLIPENCHFFGFYNWFWLLFIPFSRILYSKVFAYFPMNIMSYFNNSFLNILSVLDNWTQSNQLI